LSEIPFRIRNASALRRLAAGDLLDLTNGCSLRSFSPGEIMVREGGSPTEVFLLLSGQVSIRRSDATGRDYVVALRESGDWIGELGIVRRAAHSATVVAETATRALAIPKEAFLRVVLASPAAAGDLLEIVSNRLVESVDVRLRQLEPREDGDRVAEDQDLPAPGHRIRVGQHRSFQEATRVFQAQLIQQTLDDVDGNVSEAARRLRIARSYIYKLLSSLQVSRQTRGRPGEAPPSDPVDRRPHKE